MTDFAEQLTTARKASGMTQEQLAEQLNVSRPMISHWETGRSLPDLETVKRLSQLLGYNFLQEGMRDFTLEPAHSGNHKEEEHTPRKKRNRMLLVGFLAGAVIAISVALLIFLPMLSRTDTIPPSISGEETEQPFDRPFVEGDGSPEWFKQPNERVEGQAYLTISSPENPLRAIRTEDDGEEVIWRYNVQLEEHNGIDFTVERYVLAMFYSDTMVLIENVDAQTLASDSWWGFNTIPGGEHFWIFGDIPRRPMIGAGLMFIGVDANGNELEFHYYLELLQELKKRIDAEDEDELDALKSEAAKVLASYKQPNERIDGQAYVEIFVDENPLKAVRSAVFAKGVGWRYTFVIEEKNGIDFTVEEATIVIFITELGGVTYTYDASEVNQWWNSNVIASSEGKYYLDGDRALEDIYGIGFKLTGTDAAGNDGEFHYFLELSQEIAD